jgi:hypothetical protein
VKPRGYGAALALVATCVSIERIRRDRVLHEALTARPDRLHLALVFGLSRTTASKYTLIARDLLDGQPAEAAEAQHYVSGGPCGIPESSGVEGQRPGSCRVLPGGH